METRATNTGEREPDSIPKFRRWADRGILLAQRGDGLRGYVGSGTLTLPVAELVKALRDARPDGNIVVEFDENARSNKNHKDGLGTNYAFKRVVRPEGNTIEERVLRVIKDKGGGAWTVRQLQRTSFRLSKVAAPLLRAALEALAERGDLIETEDGKYATN